MIDSRDAQVDLPVFQRNVFSQFDTVDRSAGAFPGFDAGKNFYAFQPQRVVDGNRVSFAALGRIGRYHDHFAEPGGHFHQGADTRRHDTVVVRY